MISSGPQKRVLHVLGSLDHGGIERWLLRIAKCIDRGAVQLEVCLVGRHQGAYEAEFLRHGGVIHRTPLTANLWGFSRCFKALLSREGFDIVHSHVHHFSGLIVYLAAQARVPVRIAHSHTTTDGQSNGVGRSLYRRLMCRLIDKYATRRLAASLAAGESLYGRTWLDDATREVVYYGLDLDSFQEPPRRQEVLAELGIPQTARIVGHVGRFTEVKNHPVVVEAAEELLRTEKDVWFVLVGGGPTFDQIQEMVQTKGLQDRVRLVGPRNDVPRLMMSMDVLMLPSFWEGFPIVLLEAAAAGAKLVGSDAPGIREASHAVHESKLLPISSSPREWAEAVRGLLAHPRLTEDARQELLEAFPYTIENSLAKLLDAYGVMPTATSPTRATAGLIAR